MALALALALALAMALAMALALAMAMALTLALAMALALALALNKTKKTKTMNEQQLKEFKGELLADALTRYNDAILLHQQNKTEQTAIDVEYAWDRYCMIDSFGPQC
jgi:hypothetical protein